MIIEDKVLQMDLVYVLNSIQKTQEPNYKLLFYRKYSFESKENRRSNLFSIDKKTISGILLQFF